MLATHDMFCMLQVLACLPLDTLLTAMPAAAMLLTLKALVQQPDLGEL